MNNEYQIIDNYLMVSLPEEIDHHNSVEISTKADRFINTNKVSNVVFDFENTTFMDSSGIGILVGRYRKVSNLGGQVFVINANQRIRRSLVLSGMQKLVQIMER